MGGADLGCLVHTVVLCDAPGNPGTAEHANGLRDSPAIVGGFQLRHDHRNTGELDDKIPKARR